MPTTESSASGRKNPHIVKNWIDKGLAKCHEIAVLYPSSRNPPAWIGKINGISFVDTSALSSAANPKSNIQNPTSPLSPPCHAGVAKHEGGPSPATRHQLLATRNGDSVACFSINRAKGLERRAIILTGLPARKECAKNDYQARTFVLGATRAQQLIAVLHERSNA
jgi:hypothetical protein